MAPEGARAPTLGNPAIADCLGVGVSCALSVVVQTTVCVLALRLRLLEIDKKCSPHNKKWKTFMPPSVRH